jgi:hypothetical protein
MNLLLKRRWFSEKSTIGELFVDGQPECFTLEDRTRKDPAPATPHNEAKVWGATAIPPGTYRVIVSMSPRFKRLLPRLLDVPGFDGVLIHPGNTDKDTHGCILVGTEQGVDFIGNSRLAFNALYEKINAAYSKREPIMIEIVDVREQGAAA